MEKTRSQIEDERVERVSSQRSEVAAEIADSYVPEPKERKILTWNDIKELSNSLTEEQLRQPVKYWTEEEGGTIGDANVLDEDYVSDGEAYAPKSEMPPECVDEDEPVFPEGTVMLWII